MISHIVSAAYLTLSLVMTSTLHYTPSWQCLTSAITISPVTYPDSLSATPSNTDNLYDSLSSCSSVASSSISSSQLLQELVEGLQIKSSSSLLSNTGAVQDANSEWVEDIVACQSEEHFLIEREDYQETLSITR